MAYCTVLSKIVCEKCTEQHDKSMELIHVAQWRECLPIVGDIMVSILGTLYWKEVFFSFLLFFSFQFFGLYHRLKNYREN